MLVCAVSLSSLFEDLLKDRPLQAEGAILHNYVHTYLFITVIRKERSITSFVKAEGRGRRHQIEIMRTGMGVLTDQKSEFNRYFSSLVGVV